MLTLYTTHVIYVYLARFANWLRPPHRPEPLHPPQPPLSAVQSQHRERIGHVRERASGLTSLELASFSTEGPSADLLTDHKDYESIRQILPATLLGGFARCRRFLICGYQVQVVRLLIQGDLPGPRFGGRRLGDGEGVRSAFMDDSQRSMCQDLLLGIFFIWRRLLRTRFVNCGDDSIHTLVNFRYLRVNLFDEPVFLLG